MLKESLSWSQMKLNKSTIIPHQSVQFNSVTQSCPTLCDPMNHSTPGLPVHHQLPESSQTHVHRVGDAIQPSHPLSSPSPPATVPPSIRVFSNESTLHMGWPKYWSFSFSISPSNEYPGLISFRVDWLDLLAVQGTLKSLLQHHSSKASTEKKVQDTMWPSNSTTRHIPWGNQNWKRHVNPSVLCSTIYNSWTWKQPRCPSTDEWIKKLWYIYTMEYYSAIKRKKFESVLMRWMNLELIIQSEVSQKEKDKYRILTHIYGI